jgi:hypothetical protein
MRPHAPCHAGLPYLAISLASQALRHTTQGSSIVVELQPPQSAYRGIIARQDISPLRGHMLPYDVGENIYNRLYIPRFPSPAPTQSSSINLPIYSHQRPSTENPKARIRQQNLPRLSPLRSAPAQHARKQLPQVRSQLGRLVQDLRLLRRGKSAVVASNPPGATLPTACCRRP